ncbi:MAG: signal peptidase I [Candidatus Sericytochromatia bacterium]|nr:signal peptidase I [Candidatus Sericytochromatia bacterium]
MNNLQDTTNETIKTIMVALLIAMFTRSAVAETRLIPSESMLPTLKIDDRLIVEKLSNYVESPKRGEVVVFYPPFLEKGRDDLYSNVTKILSLPNHVAYIKRVIGLPGETIEVKDGNVYINNKVLQESYIKEKPYYNMPALKIPEKELFVMGDNRNNSADSHVWGTLPIKNIVGQAVLKYWPLNRAGSIK